MGFSNWVHVDVEEIVRETDDALLVIIAGEEVWLPKSQVSDAGDYCVGDVNVEISVTEFIALKKGFQ